MAQIEFLEKTSALTYLLAPGITFAIFIVMLSFTRTSNYTRKTPLYPLAECSLERGLPHGRAHK